MRIELTASASRSEIANKCVVLFSVIELILNYSKNRRNHLAFLLRAHYVQPTSAMLSLSKTLYSPKVLVLPRKRWLRLDMTKKLLTWTLNLNTNKQKSITPKCEYQSCRLHNYRELHNNYVSQSDMRHVPSALKNKQKIFEPRHEISRPFAYAKTKAQISFAITVKLISALVFATYLVQFLYFLNTKFQASSHLQ